MVKAVDEICASCGKSKAKIGSLTQWIGLSDSCRCAILAEEQGASGQGESGQRESGQGESGQIAAKKGQKDLGELRSSQDAIDSICQACGKHLKRSTGSLTQWVFRQDMCDCAKENEPPLSDNSDGDPSDQTGEKPSAQPTELFVDNITRLPGQVIARHYEVISCLGEGGTSLVYKAKHEFMERIVAVKVLSPDRIPDAKAIQRFQQEARSVSRLKHPGIVDVHEFGIDENKQPYLIMDYLEGNSLLDIVERDGPMKPSRAASLFLQMADALQHAHEKGVVHRDLKPTNAILTKGIDGQERVTLVDFGIAKLSEPEDKEKALTQTGEIFGSPFYMSPEQCKGLKLDHRSDIYSFGCLMFEMIIGEPAAKSGSVVETLMLHINGLTLDFDNQSIVKNYAEQAKLSNSFEDMHEQKCMNNLRQVIQGCIKKEPADRYQSMASVKRELERLLGGNQTAGTKENSFAWTGLSKKTDAHGKPAKVAVMDVLPMILVATAFCVCAGAALLKYDPFNILKKPEAKDAAKTYIPATAMRLFSAKLANGKLDPVTKLTHETASTLEKEGVVEMKMRNMEITDEDLNTISQIPTLETIDITGSSGFQPSSLVALTRLPKLKTLVLTSTDVSDALSLTLLHMPLERLDLSCTRFTDQGIEKLMESKTLHFIKPLHIIKESEAIEVLLKHGWKASSDNWFERQPAK